MQAKVYIVCLYISSSYVPYLCAYKYDTIMCRDAAKNQCFPDSSALRLFLGHSKGADNARIYIYIYI